MQLLGGPNKIVWMHVHSLHMHLYFMFVYALTHLLGPYNDYLCVCCYI